MTTTQDLKRQHKQQKGNASALLNLARLAKTEMWGGPKDLAENHDKYFVDTWNKQKGHESERLLPPVYY